MVQSISKLNYSQHIHKHVKTKSIKTLLHSSPESSSVSFSLFDISMFEPYGPEIHKLKYNHHRIKTILQSSPGLSRLQSNLSVNKGVGKTLAMARL